ncbi:MAG TPA: DUF2283 domain-containing protein [Longimicrobium sp.]
MAEPQIRYDEPSDTLYVSFAPGESATGIELNPHILLRVDKKNRRPIGITLLDFSILAQQTELGARSFPLTGLAELSPKTRELAIDLLRSAPVNEYLVLSAYTPAACETIPITLLRTEKILQQAA